MVTPTTTTSTSSSNNGVPPWHSVGFVAAVAIVSAIFFPSTQSLDELASVGTFQKRLFPHLISLRTLAFTRLALATCCWYVLLRMIFIETGWTLYTNYRPQSKLKNTWITLTGIATMCPFTSWSYYLLALNFTFSGFIALSSGDDDDDDNFGTISLMNQICSQTWFLRCAIVFWEISGPFTLLVSSVVRYAIWPIVLRGGKPHTLDNFRNQMMHNFNSVFALVELCLLGGLPLSFAHISLSCTIGVIYILFSWSAATTMHGNTRDGPQYIYFFLDTSLGKNTTIALAALLSAMTTSFGIFVALDTTVNKVGGNILVNILIVTFISSLVIRTR